MALAVLALTLGLLVRDASATDELVAVFALLVALPSGGVAAAQRLHVLAGRRRAAAARAEHDALAVERERAYDRWLTKLLDIRPDENQMAKWLEADSVVFTDEALMNYRLRRRDVIASTVLQSPVPRCRRARVKEGPSRYSRYRLRVFLVTYEGVREVGTCSTGL